MSRISRRLEIEKAKYRKESEAAKAEAAKAKAVTSEEELLEGEEKVEKPETLPGIPPVKGGEEFAEWTSEYQKAFNKKLTEQIKGNTDLISIQQKEIDDHEKRIKALEMTINSGWLSKDSRSTPSKVKFMNDDAQTGNVLIPYASDLSLGVTWPIRDPRVAEFYDSNFKVAPCKVKKGKIERQLTLEEASKAGC